MIKIIGGKFKQTNLSVLKDFVRPTSSIKREAIFSTIESYALKNYKNLYKNNAVIDLFAGSGSVGLEAISRGMSKAVFFENNKEVIKVLKKNCLKICNLDQFKIVQQDIMKTELKINISPISFIFIDPPYKKYSMIDLLSKIHKSKIINNETIIVVEQHYSEKLEFSKEFRLVNNKIFGTTSLNFLILS